jgi:hypothetical protein
MDGRAAIDCELAILTEVAVRDPILKETTGSLAVNHPTLLIGARWGLLKQSFLLRNVT